MNAATKVLTLLLSLWMAALAGCALKPTPPPAVNPVTVQLRRRHQFQFAGFYAAAQKGFYANEIYSQPASTKQ